MVQEHKITIAPIALRTAENARKLYGARSKVQILVAIDRKSGYCVRGAVGDRLTLVLLGLAGVAIIW